MINSAGGSRAWTEMVARVCKEEPYCRLRLPGCTVRSRTADHIHPKSKRPDIAHLRKNLRGSCVHCNVHRKDRPLEVVRAEMIASGKWAIPRQPPALDFFKKRETG
jgi:5-methylcytosine-specific restriction endonuclease McrA